MRSLVAALFGLWAGPAAAFCGTYVASPGVELTNQTSQIIIVRQDGRTTLSMANDYTGSATNFAMLVPVPEVLEREDITTVRPELFQRFDDYSAPRVVEYTCDDFWWDDYDFSEMDGGGGGEAGGGWEEPPTVVVEAEYEVGIYTIQIVSATDSGGLMTWLADNGYGVDAAAESLLGEYIDGGQYFFAAKVNLGAAVTDGTFLEPLQFGYESEVFSLPVRLGTLNSPGEQDVVMYIITESEDGSVGISNYTKFEIEDECMVDLAAVGGIDSYYGAQFAAGWSEGGTGEGWLQEYAWSTSSCDPCPTEKPTNDEVQEAGFEGSSWESYFTRIRLRYTPEAATEDVMLYASGIRDSEQVRFIRYNSELEDRASFDSDFEICGYGPVLDDPGSCDDDEPGTDVWDEPESTGGTDGGDVGGEDTAADGESTAADDGDDSAADPTGDEDATGGDGSATTDGGDGGTADASGGDDGTNLGGALDGGDDSVSDADTDDEDEKGGCSHAGSTTSQWVWLMGLLALFGRRRP